MLRSKLALTFYLSLRPSSTVCNASHLDPFFVRTLPFEFIRGTKRLVSVNICSVEGNSAAIFVSKVSPGIFVIKEK